MRSCSAQAAPTGLQRVDETTFFSEWQTALPGLSEQDCQLLDQVKAGYLNLRNYSPLLENTVNTAILAPLLFIGQFFLPPFHLKQEYSVEFTTPVTETNTDRLTTGDADSPTSDQSQGTVIRGRLDLLLLNQALWVTVIESKRLAYSVEAGLDQALAYMLAAPAAQSTVYGMITSGGSFMFVKLVKGTPPQYATSDIFDVRNQGNALVPVLQILKRLSVLTSPSSNGRER